MTLEETVKQLADRVAITETFHSYCRHADNLDAKSMCALFTENVVAAYYPNNPEFMINGRVKLEEMLTTALEPVVSGQHHITNTEIIFDDADTVTFYCYMYSWQRFKEHPRRADTHRWGRYELKWLRKAEGWRIDRLQLLSSGEYGGDRIAEQLGRVFPPVFA